jgi:phenylacetate-CoA ligase
MDHVFKEQLDVGEAQILQRNQDSIDVLIVPRAQYNEASERSVIKEIRSRLGYDIEIRIELVNSIAREPNGKFRAVKSEVGRNAP